MPTDSLVKKAALINNSNETHQTTTQSACSSLNVNSIHALIFLSNRSRNRHILSKFEVLIPFIIDMLQKYINS